MRTDLLIVCIETKYKQTTPRTKKIGAKYFNISHYFPEWLFKGTDCFADHLHKITNLERSSNFNDFYISAIDIYLFFSSQILYRLDVIWLFIEHRVQKRRIARVVLIAQSFYFV